MMEISHCVAHLKSASPYSQSKAVFLPDLDGENHEDKEERTWRERAHKDSLGMCYIPAAQFHLSLIEAAKFLSMPIPGNRNSKFTKHFESGIMVLQNLPIGISIGEVVGETYFVPSNGQVGGGKRVKKTFPVFQDWEGSVTYIVTDNSITEEAFLKALDCSGRLIGIGRFRPRNRGNYGRFNVVDHSWNSAR